MTGRLQSIFGVALVVILAKVLGLSREIVIAERFGTSTEYDLYLMGTMMAALAFGVLNFASFYLFVPFLTRKFEKNVSGSSESGWKDAWPPFNLALVVGAGVTGLIIISAPWVMKIWASSYSPAEFDTIIFYTRLTAVMVLLGVSEAFFRAALNVKGIFSYPAASPILFNVISILAVILLADQLSGLAIALGLLAGLILQNGYLLLRLIGFKPFKSFRPILYNAEVKTLIMTGSLLLLIELLNRSYFMIDRYFAPAFGEGVISALYYCHKLIQLPDAVVGLAIGSVLFPMFSKNGKASSASEFRDSYQKAVIGSVLIATPMAVLTMACARDMVHLVFFRGAFDLQSLTMTSNLLKPYAVSIVALFVITVSIRACYGQGWTKMVLVFTGLLLVTKWLATIVLIGLLDYPGIAAATSLSQLLFAALLLGLVAKRAKVENPVNLVADLLKLLLAGAFSLMVLSLVKPFIGSYYESFDRLSAFFRLGWSTLLLGIFYCLMLYFFGFGEWLNRIARIRIGKSQ